MSSPAAWPAVSRGRDGLSPAQPKLLTTSRDRLGRIAEPIQLLRPVLRVALVQTLVKTSDPEPVGAGERAVSNAVR
jgi:hypothetical protein